MPHNHSSDIAAPHRSGHQSRPRAPHDIAALRRIKAQELAGARPLWVHLDRKVRLAVGAPEAAGLMGLDLRLETLV